MVLVHVYTYADLIGKTFSRVKKCVHPDGEDSLCFVNDKFVFEFYHNQECSEDVHIDCIDGDLSDLENTPIISVEEVTNLDSDECLSVTWTFYKFRTIKGDVTVKWLGDSNGHYSESVDLKVSLKA